MEKHDHIRVALRTISMEQEAIASLSSRIGESFIQACDILLNCQGRVVVIGMGKSGHIANKIAATLASTGTPAFFVHPAEAGHGDFGMITSEDVVIAISNSGSSQEIITLLPLLKRLGVPLISLSGNAASPLAEAADVNLDVSVTSEACPLNLAPTSSTTVTLVMGDALAVALLESRGFTAEDFAFSHPSGALGRKLLLRVMDIMHADSEVPQVNGHSKLTEALAEMTSKGFGMTTVINAQKQLEGIFTDGDLRRCVDSGIDIHNAKIADVMTRKPRTIHKEALAAEALNVMESHKITALVVEDNEQRPIGVLHMHDLLRAGLV